MNVIRLIQILLFCVMLSSAQDSLLINDIVSFTDKASSQTVEPEVDMHAYSTAQRSRPLEVLSTVLLLHGVITLVAGIIIQEEEYFPPLLEDSYLVTCSESLGMVGIITGSIISTGGLVTIGITAYKSKDRDIQAGSPGVTVNYKTDF